MAPSKHPAITALTSRTISTRSKSTLNHPHTKEVIKGKRKAEGSPSKDIKSLKRKALCDLTNAIGKKKAAEEKGKIGVKGHVTKKKDEIYTKALPSVKTVVKPKQNENVQPPAAPGGHKIVTRAAIKHITVVPNQTALRSKEVLKESNTTAASKKRLSNEFEKTEETLYCSALEEINESTYFSAKKPSTRSSKSSNSSASVSPANLDVKPTNLSLVAKQIEIKLNISGQEVPEGVDDFDKENWDDVFQVSHYAMDIFKYLKDRELLFPIPDYMDRQICLTRWMRSLLVDWMVEIQESFELNHETLYLGVKLVDLYLSKMLVGKETLQLVGAAAMFVSSKYDERLPPPVDDFLYICDGAYTKRELLKMEINLLKVCDFNLGIPISYRFLRRYARCAKVTMPILTLARFILEYSLMDYTTVTIRDSVLASAALYLALRMKHISSWTKTLQYYTGYQVDDIKSTVELLNNGLHKPMKEQIMTVRNKYSHKIFFEVAKTPLINNENLFLESITIKKEPSIKKENIFS